MGKSLPESWPEPTPVAWPGSCNCSLPDTQHRREEKSGKEMRQYFDLKLGKSSKSELFFKNNYIHLRHQIKTSLPKTMSKRGTCVLSINPKPFHSESCSFRSLGAGRGHPLTLERMFTATLPGAQLQAQASEQQAGEAGQPSASVRKAVLVKRQPLSQAPPLPRGTPALLDTEAQLRGGGSSLSCIGVFLPSALWCL